MTHPGLSQPERPDWCVDPAFIAVFDNDIEALREFINTGGDVRAHDDICHSLLSFAIVLCRNDAVDLLIEAGADVDEELLLERDDWMSNDSCDPFRPVHLAALQPDEAIIKALIAANADLLSEFDDYESSVCHLAAENTNEQVMVAVLDADAVTDTIDATGWKPIHVAASNPNVGVMKALIEAAVSLDDMTEDEEPQAAIHFAARDNPNASVLELLLAAGADIELQDVFGNTACHFVGAREKHLAVLLERNCNLNARNRGGKTPCHEAADEGTAACLSTMLAAGGDVNCVCHVGRTMLHHAAENSDESVMKVVIEAMVAAPNNAVNCHTFESPLHVAASNPNVKVTAMLLRLDDSADALESRDDEGATPLLVAAMSGSIAVVEALLAAGACTTVVDKRQNSLCHRGAMNFDRAMISLILALPEVDKDAVNDTGDTPCHVALRSCIDSAYVLIDAGANVNAANHAGLTIAHEAAEVGKQDLLRMLLRRGVDIRAKDQQQRSICHYANADCLALLFAIGADINAKDRDGQAPIDIAMKTVSSEQPFYVLCAAGVEIPTSFSSSAGRIRHTAVREDEDTMRRIVETQMRLIALRGFEVCVGLQSARLPALVTCEILAHAFAPRENHVPFHNLWKIVTICKHFNITTIRSIS
jgi:ankyrin repeat protein